MDQLTIAYKDSAFLQSKNRTDLHICCLVQVSALLGRIPSAVGYQPTLSTDLGMLQERITTTTKGSITSVQVSLSNCLLGKSHQANSLCPCTFNASHCRAYGASR